MWNFEQRDFLVGVVKELFSLVVFVCLLSFFFCFVCFRFAFCRIFIFACFYSFVCLFVFVLFFVSTETEVRRLRYVEAMC